MFSETPKNYRSEILENNSNPRTRGKFWCLINHSHKLDIMSRLPEIVSVFGKILNFQLRAAGLLRAYACNRLASENFLIQVYFHIIFKCFVNVAVSLGAF